MGEISEAILDGFLDEETGEVIDGEAPGYPRRMSDAQWDRHPTAARKPAPSTPKPFKCRGCSRRFETQKALGHHLTSDRAKCKAKPEKSPR